MKTLILLSTLCLFFSFSRAAPALRFSTTAPQLGPPVLTLAQHMDEMGVPDEGGVALKGSGPIA